MGMEKIYMFAINVSNLRIVKFLIHSIWPELGELHATRLKTIHKQFTLQIGANRGEYSFFHVKYTL